MIGWSAFSVIFLDRFSNSSINFSDQKHRLVEPIRDELIVKRVPHRFTINHTDGLGG